MATLAELRDQSVVAERLLHQRFDFVEALARAEHVLGCLPAESEVVAAERAEVRRTALTATRVKATVLRDRSDLAAEAQYATAITLAQRLGDRLTCAGILKARVTARLNRRDISAATDAYKVLRRYLDAAQISEAHHDFRRVRIRLLEHGGEVRAAYARGRQLFQYNDDTDPAWGAATATMLGRQQAKIALGLPLRQRLAHQRLAFRHLEDAEATLMGVRQDVFSVSMNAAWGLALLSVGDWAGAAKRRDDATALLSRIGIRNTWTEELDLALPIAVRDAERSIAVAWGRAAWHRRAEPAVAYRELYKGLELLLKAAASWDGHVVHTPLSHLVGPRLVDQASKHVPALRLVLSPYELRRLADLRRARNVLAHDFMQRDARGHPIEWPAQLRALERLVRRIEEALPDQVIQAVLPRFDPFRSP